MAGEQDLAVLLRAMQPILHDEPYGFGLAIAGQAEPACFARIAEAEGVTLIAPHADLLAAGVECPDRWARISLAVHSDLAAVGLTAAIATALGARGISANVVAGYFHDHVFVQWDKRQAAMDALKSLQDCP